MNILLKISDLAILYCICHCFHDSVDPFAYQFRFKLTGSFLQLLQDLQKFAREHSSTVSMIHIVAELRVTCNFWEKESSSIILYSRTTSDNSEVWERVLFKNLRRSYLQNKNFFLLIFSPICSKSASTLKNLFQFKKFESSYGLPFEFPFPLNWASFPYSISATIFSEYQLWPYRCKKILQLSYLQQDRVVVSSMSNY